VFRAWDTVLERRVALKILNSAHTTSSGDLLAEARAAAGLNHANICIVHAVDAAEAIPMIIMEYIDGRPLSSLLQDGPLPPPTATSLGRQIASAMADAHAHDVVHGDLKPGNIMVTEAGVAKIMDFGLARRHSPSTPEDSSRPKGISGTPAYMSPEQARGEPAAPASDVFALGLILHEMITGEKAIVATHLLEALRLIAAIDPAALAGQTPEPFAGIIAEALVMDAARRTITMERIARELG
jgi:serine/threonine protein kinase